MMFQARVRDGTNDIHIPPRVFHRDRRVVRGQDGGDGPDDGTDGLVHLLVLRRLDRVFERGALVRRTHAAPAAGGGGGGDAGVFVKRVAVVVRRRLRHGAHLAGSVHVEGRVRGRQDRVGRADYGADYLLCWGRHDAVGSVGGGGGGERWTSIAFMMFESGKVKD